MRPGKATRRDRPQTGAGHESRATTVTVSAHSETGAVRRTNEDSFVANATLFAVADGMGGHARGDRASQEAVRVLTKRLRGRRITTTRVLRAVDAANSAVRALSAVDDAGVAVAGTTLAGVVRVVVGDDAVEYWMVFNVGDSRVYSWDGRHLRQLSVDHSAVQELVDAGEISAVEAAVHPERNVVTRALGASDQVEADVWLFPIAGRQSFLICSDGLSRELDDPTIAALLAGDSDPGPLEQDLPIAERLVTAAVRAGGRDNVTAIVIESLAGDGGESDSDTRDRFVRERLLEDTRPRG